MIADRAFRPAREALADRNNSRAAGPVVMLSVLVLASVLTGCGDGRPQRLKVSGQVLIDGKPLTNGYVRFVPKGARPSTGKLDENGHFTLSCYGSEDGVVPGVHQVEVNGAEYLSNKEILWHAPKKYASFRASPLQQEITESTDSLVINLSWDGRKPFKERVE